MLIELAIHDFAIIDAVRIQFGPGFNALTGETGAGKSILIDALGAVLGERASADLVRVGARSATIDATFDLDGMHNRQAITALLTELGVEPEEDLLILSREISSSGRSSARMNGRPTTAGILSQVGSLLVDVHGQSDHLSLLKQSTQLQLLDRYANTGQLREDFASRFAELRSVRAALADIASGARDRMQRIDLLRYQVDEIERAALRPCEEEELVSERARLANAELLARDAAVGYLALAGNDDAIDVAGALPSLRQAAHAFGEIVTLDPSTEPLKERLDEMLFSLEDLAAEVRTYRDLMEADPTRLGVVDERLAELRQLKRKYGADVEAVLRHAELAQTELERLTESEMDADELAAREVELGVEAGRVGWQLSQRRADAGRKLAAEIESSIAQLNMGSAAFSVALEHVEDPDGVPVANGARTAIYSADGSGIDRVSFMIAPNAGEGLKPLSRIASGGETARLMLALKSILSEADQTPTLVFDEIDVGVGGRSGQVVGEKLWGLATGHQVIVITHLPQIAAFADQHFQISKVESAQRVSSTVAQLDEDERVREIAAMLDGVPITETSLRSAEEMIERAKALKHQRAAS